MTSSAVNDFLKALLETSKCRRPSLGARTGIRARALARQRLGVRGRAKRFTALASGRSLALESPNRPCVTAKAATPRTPSPQSKTWRRFVHRSAVSVCSADFQSAVSQNCILQGVSGIRSVSSSRRVADYKSAIRQIENLRYAWRHSRASRARRRSAGFNSAPSIFNSVYANT